MSVKRTPRPLLTDRVEFEGDGPEEMAALAEALQASTPRARIARVSKVLPERAKALNSRLGANGSADNQLLDDIAAAEQEAYQADLVKSLTKEHNRRARLPTAGERHARWREIADRIRKERPYITSKAEIARMVRRQLVNSHDERDHEFIKSADTIRRAI